MARGGYHYSSEEVKFIEDNYRAKTDKEIGRILGRAEESVARQRKKYGWIKSHGRPSKEEVREARIELIQSNPTPISLATLDKNERLNIYKKNFNKNPRYESLLNELHQNEFEYYRHKYVEFMDSIDTITIQEEDALHHMIMSDISISRIRRRIKDMEQANKDDDSQLIFGFYTHLDNEEKKFREYQKTLRVTRESRLKEDKEEKETFVTMVNMYRNKSAREEMGRQAGLMEKYKELCKQDMKTSRYLLGD